MKFPALLSLVSVVFATCEVTVRGTGKPQTIGRILNTNVWSWVKGEHQELFKLTFTDQGTRPEMQLVPTLQKFAAFHYTASDNCGECLILAQDVGSGRFIIKDGETKMYALGANDSTPGSVYVRCGLQHQKE